MGRARISSASLLVEAFSAFFSPALTLPLISSNMAAPDVALRSGSILFQSMRVTTLRVAPLLMKASRRARPVAVSKPSTPWRRIRSSMPSLTTVPISPQAPQLTERPGRKSALREAMSAFVDKTQETVTGDVKAPSWPDDRNSPTGKVESWSHGGGAPWQSASFDAETNTINMMAAADKVSTGLITYAARDSEYDGKRIRKGEIMALENGKIVSTSTDITKATYRLARNMCKKDSSFVTIISGCDVSDEDAEKVTEIVKAKCPNHVEVSHIRGGQPVYYYMISVE